jgi:hypothetical protein
MRARATDPYKLLSVPWDADELTVRKRYRQLAKQHHPNAGGDSEDFRLLKEAFEQILFDVRNNIEEDVTIARVRPEENRKQELNEEPNFRKNPRAAPVHERSSKAEQPTAQVSGTSRYMNVQLKLRNRSCSDPHAPVRKKRGHRITLANWRHAFYERHPFVTLGGLLTGLLLTGLLLKAPLVSSSSSPELRKPPHKLRNTAAPIATWSSSSESLARSVPPALPEPNVAARLLHPSYLGGFRRLYLLHLLHSCFLHLSRYPTFRLHLKLFRRLRQWTQVSVAFRARLLSFPRPNLSAKSVSGVWAKPLSFGTTSNTASSCQVLERPPLAL